MNIFNKIFQCKQSLEEFKLLFDISPAVVIRCDKKGNVIYANKAFEDKFGYPLSEFLYKIFVGDLYKGGIEEAKKIMRLLRSKDYGGVGKLINYETIGITRYGEEIPFLVNASIVYKNGKEDGSAGYLFDITDRKFYEKELQIQKEKYRSLLENASIGMFILSNNEKLEYFNKKFQELLGYSDLELKHINFFTLLEKKEDIDSFKQIIYKINSGDAVKLPFETILKKKNGEKIFVEIFLNLINYDEKIMIQGFVSDITKRKLLELELIDVNKKLKELSIKDELTEVYNLRYFREMLKLKYLESKRYNTHLSLIIVDIDDFKKINDTYGHDIGDIVLIKLTQTVKKIIRKGDLFIRYGGEEFLIILPNSNIENTYKIAEKIRKEIENLSIEINDKKLKFTISLGISEVNILDNSLFDSIKRADVNLYKAKQKGKNRVEI